MTFEEIMLTAFASEFTKGQFGLSDNNDGLGVVISFWQVTNVTEPTHAEVMAMDTPAMEFKFAYDTFINDYLKQLASVIDDVARQRNYDSSISCVSYLNSTNLTWKIDADTFNVWRDSVWNYLYAQQVLILNKTRPIPTVAQLNAELPVIVWP